MRIKTVLIIIGSEQDDGELARAAPIARALGAHLSVLVIGVAPPPPTSPYGIVSNDLWAGEIREGQAVAQARAERAADFLKAEHVEASVASQFIDRGAVATLAARAARYADMTIVTPQAEGQESLQNAVINGALFESGRPVLVMPRAGKVSFPASKRVMIAWDASVEASKAVHLSIDLLRAADQVDAVLIDPVPSFEGHGPEPGADLAAYLARHGIEAAIHRVPREGQDIATVLQRQAKALSADLIVMGGFGHSRLRQRIFGGTTTSILDEAPLPVLMAH